MASNRIAWNQAGTSSPLSKLRAVVAALQGGREILSELKLILDKYNADYASMGVDLGVSTADAQTLYNLVAQSAGELGGLATTQVNVGSPTGTRQLIDALG